MSNSPSNITTISSGYNTGYHGLSSTNNEQPYDTKDQSQSIVSSANLGTTHQQAGYVHSSSVHATMENNIGQYTLGYDQSQLSIVSSANLGTTHQQAGYVHSSSVHPTMGNNTGQDHLGCQNSMQQMTQLGNNTLDHSSQNQYYYDAGGNQFYYDAGGNQFYYDAGGIQYYYDAKGN
ncbi:hypothetical protein BVRB_4g076830 [Beta vulgaris subsp. vulgaris]|nr:hypothetical protein BVRB_4g076830 [Beta vulgaris subsp. vulgaris]